MIRSLKQWRKKVKNARMWPQSVPEHERQMLASMEKNYQVREKTVSQIKSGWWELFFKDFYFW